MGQRLVSCRVQTLGRGREGGVVGLKLVLEPTAIQLLCYAVYTQLTGSSQRPEAMVGVPLPRRELRNRLVRRYPNSQMASG